MPSVGDGANAMRRAIVCALCLREPPEVSDRGVATLRETHSNGLLAGTLLRQRRTPVSTSDGREGVSSYIRQKQATKLLGTGSPLVPLEHCQNT